MRKRSRIDWTGTVAMTVGALGAGLTYVIALVVLFGPMAHAVARLG